MGPKSLCTKNGPTQHLLLPMSFFSRDVQRGERGPGGRGVYPLPPSVVSRCIPIPLTPSEPSCHPCSDVPTHCALDPPPQAPEQAVTATQASGSEGVEVSYVFKTGRLLDGASDRCHNRRLRCRRTLSSLLLLSAVVGLHFAKVEIDHRRRHCQGLQSK